MLRWRPISFNILSCNDSNDNQIILYFLNEGFNIRFQENDEIFILENNASFILENEWFTFYFVYNTNSNNDFRIYFCIDTFLGFNVISASFEFQGTRKREIDSLNTCSLDSNESSSIYIGSFALLKGN